MDYREKIKSKWPSKEVMLEWLDKNFDGWRQSDPSIAVDCLLRSSLNFYAYAHMEPKESRDVEKWVIRNYLIGEFDDAPV